mgnify:CR=1 FL=1
MQHTLEEVQYKAISAMVLKLWREYGNELRITGLRDAFKGGTIEELGVVGDQRIKDLAIMLNPYAKGGQYERFFEGRNNIDFSNDFIVIENEELKRRPDLHAVVNILPVSYTHLRAHETVLDLVCRLLLEKKKRTQESFLRHKYNHQETSSKQRTAKRKQ